MARAGRDPLPVRNDVLNDDGKAFQQRAKDVLAPILADAAKRGFRLRDILYIFQNSMQLEAAFLVTQRRFQRLRDDAGRCEDCSCANEPAIEEPGSPGGDGA